MTAIIFIIVLSIIVFVHELGHFVMAKRAGMKVEEFGFGFPPRLWGYKPKNSETTYSINWIPFGGFVKIQGEDGEDREDHKSFGSKKFLPRAGVILAGVAMNVIVCDKNEDIYERWNLPYPIMCNDELYEGDDDEGGVFWFEKVKK